MLYRAVPVPAGAAHFFKDNKIMYPKFPYKRARFVAEYLADPKLNATAAAIKAGFNPKSAKRIACALLKNPKIRQQIDKEFEARQQRTFITADRVLLELYHMATVDPYEAYKDDGGLKDVKDMPEELRRAIAGIEVDEIWDTEYGEDGRRKVQIGVTKKIKFWDKNKAAEMLAKHLKLIEPGVQKVMSLNGDADDQKFRDEFFGLKTGDEKSV